MTATSVSNRALLGSPWVPQSLHHRMRRNARVYNIVFSKSGSMLVSATQDETIDVTAVGAWARPRLQIQAQDVAWAVTSVDVSPDERLLAYSSMDTVVHLASTEHAEAGSLHEALDLSPAAPPQQAAGRRTRRRGDGFGIFQTRFSPGGTELVCGTNDHCILTYDIERKRVVDRIADAHSDDINAVGFVDAAFKPNLLASASDDGLLKIWDRRDRASQTGGSGGGSADASSAPGSGSSPPTRPSGCLVGHLNGLTSVDSRGDGVYLVTNGKDQCAKLWDLRVMSSSSSALAADGATRSSVSTAASARAASAFQPPFDYDYRWEEYPGVGDYPARHPHDCSVMTFRGHRVLQTLVRAYFSPAETTGQRYIYTGSADGGLCVYDVVSGELISRAEGHSGCVRDCSWHPFLPLLATASFDGSIGLWTYGSDEALFQRQRRLDQASAAESCVRRGRSERAARLAAARSAPQQRTTRASAARAAAAAATSAVSSGGSSSNSGSSGASDSMGLLEGSAGVAATSGSANAVMPTHVPADASARFAAADTSASAADAEYFEAAADDDNADLRHRRRLPRGRGGARRGSGALRMQLDDEDSDITSVTGGFLALLGQLLGGSGPANIQSILRRVSAQAPEAVAEAGADDDEGEGPSDSDSKSA